VSESTSVQSRTREGGYGYGLWIWIRIWIDNQSASGFKYSLLDLDHHRPRVAASSSLAVTYSTDFFISFIDSFVLLVPVQDEHQGRRDANDAVEKPLLAAEISFMSRTLARPLRRSSILPKITLVRHSPWPFPNLR